MTATNTDIYVNAETVELFAWVFISAFVVMVFLKVYKSIVGSWW